MANEFQVRLWSVGLGAYQWVTPPDDAVPEEIGADRLEYAPVVRRNAPEKRTGRGTPCGVDDELFAIVGRSRINTTGLAWWYDTVGLAGNDYIEIGVNLFDPETQTWRNYMGYMWRPVWDGAFRGHRLLEFRVLISNLELMS